MQQLLRICVRKSAVRTPLLHLQSAPWSAQALVGGRTERHRVIVDNEPTHTLSPIYTVMAFLARAFRFLWCILWLNYTSYSKSVKRDK